MIVQRIDHILWRVESEVKLDLPEVWPLTQYPHFASAGYWAGNVVVEVVRFGPPRDPPRAPRLFGIAFEPPSLDEAVAELKRRGIRHGPPLPYRHQGRILWRNALVGGLFGGGASEALFFALMRLVPSELPDPERSLGGKKGGFVERALAHGTVFLVDYQREFHDPAATRARLGVGPGVKTVVVGARNRARGLRRWQKLLGDGDGEWPLGDGPSVRVVEAPTDGILSLEGLDLR